MSELSFMVQIPNWEDQSKVKDWYSETFGSTINATRMSWNDHLFKIFFKSEDEMSMWAKFLQDFNKPTIKIFQNLIEKVEIEEYLRNQNS